MATAPEQRYLDGYDRVRTVCLIKGVDAARQWLNRSTEDAACRDGAKAAIFDYEDANGLPHSVNHLHNI
jgi:hypothetical protein